MHAQHACHAHRGQFPWPLFAGATLVAMGSRGGGGRHGHRGGGPRGFGAGGGFPFGGPESFRGFGRGPKARRGDIRTAMLLLLAEEPRNGYQIIQELESRTGGNWRVSAGSVYPGLQQLEDEGLVRSDETSGRKLFALTDEGRAAVDRLPGDQAPPWETMAGDVDDERFGLAQLLRQVAGATMQVMQAGTEAQVKEAGRVLSEARKALYRLLAEDEPPTGDDR